MTELFLRVFNLSVSAGWFVLAVLVLRLLLRKAPKWTAPALWGLVGLRLLLPFSIESPFSLLPSAETVSPEILMDPKPAIDSGLPALDRAVNPVLAESFTPNPGDSANPLQIWLFLAAAVWLIGAAVMLLYALVSYLRLKKRVGTAVRLRDNIFQSENVPSPFVLGVVRPRVYLPFSMGKEDMAHVIAHEEAHIARRDHWWKALASLLLAAHWFNPLLWTAYILLCRDIEMACDERVIKSLEPGPRADYSQALLNCGVRRRTVAACPLAFGEVGVKERVKRVLSYKKPAVWLTVAAVAACAVAAVCFLTDPARGEDSTANGPADWSFEGTVFRYQGKEFDLAEREGLINAIMSCTPAGRYLVVKGHVGPKNGVYCIFDTDAGEFVKDIVGNHLIWEGDDLTTAVYSFWNGVYYYDGRLAKKFSLAEDEYIQSLEFTDSSYQVQVNIRGPGEWERAEYVTLARFPNADSAGDGPAGELTMDLLRELNETGNLEGVDFAAYSNAVQNDLNDTAKCYYLTFTLEYQGKSYRLDVSRMKDDNSLSFVELRKLSNGEILWLYNASHENLVDRDLDGFLAYDYDIRDEVSWTTPAGLTETEYQMDYGPAGGVLLKPNAYEPLKDPESWSCPPEWTAAGMVAHYYTDVVEWNGAEIGMVYGFYNHTDPEPLGPVDGLCAPAYLVKSEHDLYTVNDLAQLEEQGVDTENLETTSEYWYVWFARPGEEQGVVISLNAKNFTQEDILEFARSVQY